MKDIKHHLTNSLLMGYAAGTLPEAFNLVVATHISLCDECRAQLAEFEAVGGEVMMRTDAMAMNADALDIALAALTDSPEEVQIKAERAGIFPTPLADYVGGDVEAVRWRRVGGGVKQMILPTDSGATVRLLHIPAGASVPDHGHRGLELTLVLQGAFKDETDRFGTGDIEVANEELDHTPVAEDGLDCICLAATDAPLKFNSFLPRLAQPFVKI
ncbi:transcriptional regulator [Marivivens donghaensis]|uniref:Transcriptional regulator n=1 Tax=Marivivens donghaensis TaxID=1699413 RepID=A0ABX0VUX5_9RHOB|nr:ChrR family anti-sigma-E factor [Marivivens donghaensis]NIY71640.1 transcriptional regulator [Marivivens donghaensis]